MSVSSPLQGGSGSQSEALGEQELLVASAGSTGILGGAKGSPTGRAPWAKGAGAQQVSSCVAPAPTSMSLCPQDLAHRYHRQQAPQPLRECSLLLKPHVLSGSVSW